ncbi:MAG: hypothetical protein ABI175_01825 [Polyangiales bacterium]
MIMKRTKLPSLAALLSLAALVLGAVAVPACSSKTTLDNGPASIKIEFVTPAEAGGEGARLPISFLVSDSKTFAIDLAMLDANGKVRTSFDNWVRLSVQPGEIVETIGETGQVLGPNVLLQGGVAKNIRVRLSDAYGNTRIIAQDVGYIPAPPSSVSQCSDGKDNDNNGFADYPVDPNCLFLTDDSEGPFSNAYGTSPPIYYEFPRIHDVQGRGTTPFNGKQVEIPGTGAVHMYVSHITKDGMFIVDAEDDLGPHTPEYNAIFIYNFNPPAEIHLCDRITRLNGNVSIFGGSIQLGTAAWSKDPWLNPGASGDCALPDFVEVSDKISGQLKLMQPLQGRLMRVQDPEIGNHFGKTLAPGGVPAVGASNCDLNGDGIAGCIASKGGFRTDENACCAACNADPLCTEYNDYLARGHFKIRFGEANGALFAQFSQVANFDPKNYLGPGKFLELRGSITTFILPSELPSFTVQARCVDDVILAEDTTLAECTVQEDCTPGFVCTTHKVAADCTPTTTPPCTAKGRCAKDVGHSCVCYRAEPDSECSY